MATASNGKTIWIKGACPHDCPDTCATLTEVDPATGRAVNFTGDPDHPITDGWLCAKVRPYLERVYAPGSHPLSDAASRTEGFRPVRADHLGCRAGRDFVALDRRSSPSTGRRRSCPTPTAARSGRSNWTSPAAASGAAWARAMSVGDLCSGATRAAANATIGGNYGPDPRDVLHSKLVLIWAHNPASTSPHFVPLLREAQRNGAKVVVIDPRRTQDRPLGRSAHPDQAGHRYRAGARR